MSQTTYCKVYILLFIITSFLGYGQEEKAASKDSILKKDIDSILLNRLYTSYDLHLDGDFQGSLKYNLKTIDLAIQAGNHVIAHESYSFLGYDYLILTDTLKALQSFEKSYTYAQKTDDPSLIANAYVDFAEIYTNNDSTYNKGIKYLERAIEIYRKDNNTKGVQSAYFNYASFLFEKDVPKFEQALDSLVFYAKYRSRVSGMTVQTLCLQGAHYLRSGDIKSAVKIMKKARSNAEQIGSAIYLEDAYKIYAEALAASNDYPEAYAMLSKYDSIFQINEKDRNSSKSKQIIAQFNLNKAEEERDQAQLKAEIEKQKVQNRTIINYILTGVIVLGSVLVFFLYYISRKRKSYINELRIKNVQVEKAKMVAERLAKVKSNFFSTVSHELRTPLYGVIGLSSILLEKNKDKENLHELESLKFSADYLLALVNDVLHLNKIDSTNKLEQHDDIFDLKSLIQKITSSFEYLKTQNKNTLQVVYKGDIPPLIKGNSTQLSQILMNLIGNACKFTENGKIIVLINSKVIENSCSIEFSIRDTGQGIPSHKIKQIFEEFAQGESKNITYQGTGLGLSIVKRLLTAAGSKIHVESYLGKGSTFSFKMSYKLINHNLPYETKTIAKVYNPNDLKGKYILVVEDNKINQIVTKQILEKKEVICDIAENGQEAINKAKSATYDLILMDIHMPVMNGIKATKEIRKFSQVPILALTAVELDEMREKIYASGMNDIIVKPYDTHDFQQSILRAMECCGIDN